MLTLVTFPDPLYTAAEAKTMAPGLAGASDAQADAWLMAAHIDAQFYTGRAIGQQTWDWNPWRHSSQAWGCLSPYDTAWPYYPLTLKIPMPPLLDVNFVKYRDTAGVLQTVDAASYVVSGIGGQGYITLASGAAWPTVGDFPDPVVIRFTAGEWEPDGIVPEGIKQAILLKATTLQAGIDSGGGASGALRSRTIEGLGSETYDTGSSARSDSGSSNSAANSLLNPYRVFS